MIDENRQTKDAVPTMQDTPARDLTAMTGQPGMAVSGEVEDMVDPYDYAETIVRDLALHVGTRLRDFRDDLAAMHQAVVQLPETMRINAMGQSIQDLRDRVIHLTGLVSLQTTRPAEEAERLGRGMNELVQRVAGLEAWIAAAKRAGVQNGEFPAIPLPDGGLVGMEQFDRVIDQFHESLVKLVGAVRELQLDVRDVRSDLRGDGRAEPTPVAQPAAPAPAPSWSPPGVDPAQVDRLAERLGEVEARLRALAAAPPPPPPQPSQPIVASPPPAPAQAPAALAEHAQIAALAFGAWHRLSQPVGAEPLQAAVGEVLSQLSSLVPQMTRQPRVTKGSGLVAVGAGRIRGAHVSVLVAIEDLCGHSWMLSRDGADMTATEPQGLVRTPCWRALLATAAVLEQARPETTVVPILVYGNGWIDRVPTREDMVEHGRAIGALRAAGRVIAVSASGIGAPGLLLPSDVAGAVVGAI